MDIHDLRLMVYGPLQGTRVGQALRWAANELKHMEHIERTSHFWEERCIAAEEKLADAEEQLRRLNNG